MKNIQLLLILTISIFIFTQCQKSNEAWSYPDITTSGNNTFGCLIDGEEWTPKKSPNNTGITSIEQPLRVRYEEVPNMVFVNASHYYSETHRESIAFAVQASDKGIYEVVPGGFFKGGKCWGNTIDTSLFNQVEILEFSITQRIVSGTFEFSVISTEENCSDTIQITEGRFDVEYRD